MPDSAAFHCQRLTRTSRSTMLCHDPIDRSDGVTSRTCVSAPSCTSQVFLSLAILPALSKMEPDWWFELNRDYGETIKYRQALFGERGPRVLQTLPGCELAAKELMEMALQFLCARYPNLFYLDQ